MLDMFSRLYQTGLRAASFVLPWRKPELLQGAGSIQKLSGVMKELNFHKVLIVTDKGITALGLMDPMLKGFEKDGIGYTIYDKTVPNPTIDNIEEALAIYHKEGCEAIVAYGGGSSMDCGKGVAVRVARPEKTISQMKGILKVRKKLPTIFAVPTTSGTGSEATLAAVITDSLTHEKYAINDVVLIPRYAVLDPVLTEKLPPHITSTTGMDALTHAVEAYIGRSNTKETKALSRRAVKLIYENIREAYQNGSNLEARENMQLASFFAGMAFTRAYVGNVHAVAHTLGGFYSIPHGLANAVILPYVLEAYGDTVYTTLSELYDLIGCPYGGTTQEEKAKAFIRLIRELNREMNIPEKIKGIKAYDIPVMVDRAYAEAVPVYPVLKIMPKPELSKIYDLIMEKE
jgi:alcohol dehydrogenase class IV